LSRFIPILKRLLDTSSTEGLQGFPAAWREAANDPLFRQAQDKVNDELYYYPAMATANELNLQMPLSRFALYDAAIEHGIGDDSDSLSGIIHAATRAADGLPDKVGEKTWLAAFLTARKHVLLNAADPDTRTAWRESVGRVDEQLRLFRDGNWQLSTPITLNPYGTAITVT
jgi:chitosanase